MLAGHHNTKKSSAVLLVNGSFQIWWSVFKHITPSIPKHLALKRAYQNDGIFFIQDSMGDQKTKTSKTKTHNSFWQQIGCYRYRYWVSDLEPGMMYFPTKWGPKQPRNRQNHRVASCVEPKVFCFFFHKQKLNRLWTLHPWGVSALYYPHWN